VKEVEVRECSLDQLHSKHSKDPGIAQSSFQIFIKYKVSPQFICNSCVADFDQILVYVQLKYLVCNYWVYLINRVEMYVAAILHYIIMFLCPLSLENHTADLAVQC